MIQKISFGSTYLFKSKNQQKKYQDSDIITLVAVNSLHSLAGSDKIKISKMPNNDQYLLTAPDYMDDGIKKYCRNKGIEYEKY